MEMLLDLTKAHTLGRISRLVRQQLGLSSLAMAKKIGTSPPTLASWESGRVQYPSAATGLRLWQGLEQLATEYDLCLERVAEEAGLELPSFDHLGAEEAPEVPRETVLSESPAAVPAAEETEIPAKVWSSEEEAIGEAANPAVKARVLKTLGKVLRENNNLRDQLEELVSLFQQLETSEEDRFVLGTRVAFRLGRLLGRTDLQAQRLQSSLVSLWEEVSRL